MNLKEMTKLELDLYHKWLPLRDKARSTRNVDDMQLARRAHMELLGIRRQRIANGGVSLAKRLYGRKDNVQKDGVGDTLAKQRAKAYYQRRCKAAKESILHVLFLEICAKWKAIEPMQVARYLASRNKQK